MATAAHAAQAVGMAAVICLDKKLQPAALYHQHHTGLLQTELLKTGHHIPGLLLDDANELVKQATIKASSELVLKELPESGLLKSLETAVAQMVPLKAGKVQEFIFHAEGNSATQLEVELRISSKINNHTPDVTIEKKTIPIQPGRNCINISFDAVMQQQTYAFITFLKNPDIQLHFSTKRITGILSVFNSINKAVSNYGKQTPPEDLGVDAFEFWCPKRRPDGENIAFKYPAGIDLFTAGNIANGIDRPVAAPNAWVADPTDTQSTTADQLAMKKEDLEHRHLLRYRL